MAAEIAIFAVVGAAFVLAVAKTVRNRRKGGCGCGCAGCPGRKTKCCAH